MWVTTTNPDQPLTEQATYIWNRCNPEQPVTDPARMAAIAEVIVGILDDNLPWIEPLDLDVDQESGVHVEDVKELRYPLVSWGQCDTVVAAVCGTLDYSRLHREAGLVDVASVTPVQALAEASPVACHFHDAVLVGLKDGTVFVLDFTFSQFDPVAAWPLVTGPGEWEALVVPAAAAPSIGDVWRARQARDLAAA